MSFRKVTLDDSWREVKKLRDKGLTYAAIGEIYGVTKQCIQQGLARRYKKFKKLSNIFRGGKFMIKYSETQKGDILRIVGAGAPGYAENGELVKVTETEQDSVVVENRNGVKATFMFDCGAARLEQTQWKNEFPS